MWATTFCKDDVKKLTKAAIVVTGLSAVTLGLTWNVTQSLESDGKHLYDVITWHIPLYKDLYFQDEAWWIFIRIWLISLILPLTFWAAVGIRTLISKARRHWS